jgi:hypothetical protein
VFILALGNWRCRSCEMFDLNKLKQLDSQGARAGAIDHLMEYWDTEFSAGRFDEFQSFVDHLDFDSYSAEVVCCISTIGWWIKEKFKFSSFVERIRKYYTDKGFSDDKIKSLMSGIDR